MKILRNLALAAAAALSLTSAKPVSLTSIVTLSSLEKKPSLTVKPTTYWPASGVTRRALAVSSSASVARFPGALMTLHAYVRASPSGS